VRRRRGWCAAVLLLAPLLLGPEPVAAGEPSELARLFPFAADVFVAEDGLARLELSDPVLSQSGEADRRIVDRGGEPVPFLLDPGTEVEVESLWTAPARVLDVDRGQVARERLPPRTSEDYELAWPEAVPAGESVALVVEAAPQAYVRSVSVAGRRGDELVVLVQDRPLSRIAASAARLDRIELPRFDGESIVVRIRGDEGFYLEPRFRFESRRTRKADDASSIPLRIRSQRQERGRTIVELERPNGVVPEALRVTSSTPSFDRSVEIFDVGSAAADRALGDGRILRAAGPGQPIEARDVRVHPAEGTGLRVEIVDGSSPPLGALEFAARVRRPALLFQVPARSEGPAATLYFGGGRAVAPDYDIAALLPDPDRSLTGERAQIAARLRDDASLVRARLGEVRRNPAYDDEPALGFAMRAGAELDPRTFAHRRRLTIGASADGLSDLSLSPDDLALARADLGDLRIVDDRARQWPYLLDPGGTSNRVELDVERSRGEAGSSIYTFRPTRSPLRTDALRLVAQSRFFDRDYRLVADTEDGRRSLAAGRLRGARGESEVVISFPETRLDALELTVVDGDDAPLELSASADVRLPRLYVAAAPGDYALLLGDASAESPSYDLGRAREMVRALRSVPISAGAIEPNPEYQSLARLFSQSASRPLLQRVLLWATILAAVAVLIFLTLRLARSGSDDSA
jgi:hypothetical protein